MQLVITPGGAVRCVYGEEIDLHRSGQPTITRGVTRRTRRSGTLVGRPVAGRRSAARAVPLAAVKPWRPKAAGWKPLAVTRQP